MKEVLVSTASLGVSESSRTSEEETYLAECMLVAWRAYHFLRRYQPSHRMLKPIISKIREAERAETLGGGIERVEAALAAINEVFFAIAKERVPRQQLTASLMVVLEF